MADVVKPTVKIIAFPQGFYTDITADWLHSAGINAFWGIRGVEKTDILADVGSVRFTLKNIDKYYYPDGSSGINGWANNIPVKIIFDYGEVSFTRFHGYLNIDGLRYGRLIQVDKAPVTLSDWMIFATRTPIKTPNIEENKKINQGITTLLTSCPIQPQNTSLETGDYTFPVIFDNLDIKTKAYNEFAKFAYSESPGHIYLTKDMSSGETLVSENSTHRDNSHALSSTTAYTPKVYKRIDTNDYKRIDGNDYNKIEITAGTTTTIQITSDIDAVEIDYGKNVINYAAVTAYPKRVDTEPQILYALDYPMYIEAGQTIRFRAPYADRSNGRKIGAIVSSMISPVAPGATDTNMKLLCHFTSDTTDSTGNHTVTANDVTIETDNYIDVGPEPDVQRVSGSILGPYALFGGYANYNLSVASSSDFELGSGAFTIGFYAVIMNPSSDGAIIARDGTTNFVPWMIGSVDGTNIEIYMSSNGASWDIANGESLGQVQLNRWVHYEVSRDSDGWFYAFADGKLTANWYSAGTFPANSNALSIGKSQGANYIFMALDELYIKKGECLHKEDFEPPKENLSHLLDGDYWLNTAIDETGTDNSSNLAISATYNSNSVYYVVTNNSASNGYFYIQARGFGVYSYNPIEDDIEDSSSQLEYGYQEKRIQQQYQQNLIAGKAWATDIIETEASARTRLKSISFYANRNATTMARFLQGDVGMLVYIEVADPELTGYYYIQSVNFEVRGGDVVYVTWGLKEGLTPA